MYNHNKYSEGDIVRLVGSMNYKNELAVITRPQGEDRYIIHITRLGITYCIHAIYLRPEKEAYDGNKVVAWNTCHWKPGSYIVASEYEANIRLLSTCMKSIQHNSKENRRGS